MIRESTVGALLGALAVFLGGAPLARAGGGPENVLVVVNDAVPESLVLGRYYVIHRRVPRQQFLHVNIPGGVFPAKEGYAGYRRLLELPVRRWLDAHPQVPITTIVLMRGIPIRAQAAGPVSSPRSTTHMLALLALPEDHPLRSAAAKGLEGAQANPLHGADRSVDPRDPSLPGLPLYAVSILDAFTLADAEAMVDRAVASDRGPPHGTIYLGESRAKDPRGMYNGDYPDLKRMVEESVPGVSCRIVPHPGTAVLLQGREDVLYYRFGQAKWDPSFPTLNRYLPGAVIDDLTSAALTPASFDPENRRGQTGMPWFLAAGATAVHGCMAEPTTAAWDAHHLELRRFVAGYDLAESFLMGHPILPWRNLVVDDPLLQPFALRPRVKLLRVEAKGRKLELEVEAEATRPGAGIAALELYRNGVRVNEVDAAHAEFSIPDFRDGIDQWRVVARDDSRFRSQGEIFSAALPRKVRGVKAELRSWSRGRAEFRISGSSPPVYTWVAPGAERPLGRARGRSLKLHYPQDGGEAHPVDLWIHNAAGGEIAFSFRVGGKE